MSAPHIKERGDTMFRASAGAPRGLRWGILILVAGFALVAVGSDPADARGRHRRHKHKSSYSPPYAAIVVDANSGRVLHSANADNLRHPASITKIMTLYLLFEQIEAGRLKLDSQLPVSARAAAQPPTKLGLRAGDTVAVEDAIKALVTKSANDMAVVIGEAIAGDEAEFARMMTRKARALGMSRTVYANASGLPNDEQVTSAHDQALLGRAIQDRFPRYYRYFATSSFYFRGRAMRNHNHLLGRVAGVDGIKTGYIRKSGFNLVTSVRRGNRHIVAVVMGGSSAGARDARMRSLIEQYVAQGATERTMARITETAQPTEARATPKLAAPPITAASLSRFDNGPAPVQPTRTEAAGRPIPGSAEPISAIPVKTLIVRPAAGLQSAAPSAPAAAAAGPTPPPASTPAATYQTASAAPLALPPPLAARLAAPAQPPVQAAAAPAPAAAPTPLPARAHSRSGWLIQIGAFPQETEALQKLQTAQAMAKSVLATAEPFTERVNKGGESLYRARFAGLDEERAEAACKYFKRNKIDCFALKN